VAMAQVWLGDSLTAGQWAGAGLLLLSMALVRFEPARAHVALNFVWLRWIRPPKPALPPDVEAMMAAREAERPREA